MGGDTAVREGTLLCGRLPGSFHDPEVVFSCVPWGAALPNAASPSPGPALSPGASHSGRRQTGPSAGPGLELTAAGALSAVNRNSELGARGLALHGSEGPDCLELHGRFWSCPPESRGTVRSEQLLETNASAAAGAGSSWF